MSIESEKREKDKKATKLLLICVGIGFILWAVGGAIGKQLPPGWKDILQGGFVLLWIVVGGIWYSKKIKTLR